MGYKIWFDNHAKKHKQIVDKLLEQKYTKEQIIDYFEFENICREEIDFCPLYAKNEKCHDVEDLNCYLCACPNFRFDDDGIRKIDQNTEYSSCSIKSKDGEEAIYGEQIHQDCSKCLIPHSRNYIYKHFDLDWRYIMRNVGLKCD
ncbi:MAG: hypothetical protein U9R27_05985 [Campylobacterota bacterium]|nr:hypothetical protein [Campylobacterota bacterium]